MSERIELTVADFAVGDRVLQSGYGREGTRWLAGETGTVVKVLKQRVRVQYDVEKFAGKVRDIYPYLLRKV